VKALQNHGTIFKNDPFEARHLRTGYDNANRVNSPQSAHMRVIYAFPFTRLDITNNSKVSLFSLHAKLIIQNLMAIFNRFNKDIGPLVGLLPHSHSTTFAALTVGFSLS